MALFRIVLRNSFSSLGSRSALPKGFTILLPAMILFDPTMKATGIMEQTWAVGIPARSNSLESVAPQRVLVPQVDVRITPETDSALSSAAICFPILIIVSTTLATPAVV
jgi:hypothetical protein